MKQFKSKLCLSLRVLQHWVVRCDTGGLVKGDEEFIRTGKTNVQLGIQDHVK